MSQCGMIEAFYYYLECLKTLMFVEVFGSKIHVAGELVIISGLDVENLGVSECLSFMYWKFE